MHRTQSGWAGPGYEAIAPCIVHTLPQYNPFIMDNTNSVGCTLMCVCIRWTRGAQILPLKENVLASKMKEMVTSRA